MFLQALDRAYLHAMFAMAIVASLAQSDDQIQQTWLRYPGRSGGLYCTPGASAELQLRLPCQSRPAVTLCDLPAPIGHDLAVMAELLLDRCLAIADQQREVQRIVESKEFSAWD